MKKRVLLVEEDKDQLVSFLEIFKHIEGPLKCTHADSGRQALDVLQHTVPDFIFIDYDLSEIDALQLVAAIRFQAKLRETKLYLYSGSITDESSKMARMLGATGCIEMSGEISDLIHKFKAIFSPELLPSYVFLRNHQNQFLCFNAAFLSKENEDEVIRDFNLPTGNINVSSNGNRIQNELRDEPILQARRKPELTGKHAGFSK